MLTAGITYFEKAIATILKVQETQAEALAKASEWIKDSLEKGGVLHVFGSGHSHAISEDVFWRAGGLGPVNAILDVNLTMHGGGSPTRGTTLERLEGYASIILENYDLRKDEVIIVISNSGINAVPIEVAQITKAMGLKVIALTNLEQSRNAKSRHSSGKRLFELADLVIDSCVVPGDACIEIAPNLPKTAPLSTVVCCAILQSIVAEIGVRMYKDGVPPPVGTSANVPEGDAALDKFRKNFGGGRLRVS
jgi:uncharacterized phosphosugar-binding protein